MTALGSRMLAALATSLLLVLVGFAAFPRAQKPGVSAPQWEYKTVVHTSPPPPLPPGRSRQSSSTLPGGHGLPTLVEQLNREGADGWELADVISDAGLAHGLMVFKRIKQSPAMND